MTNGPCSISSAIARSAVNAVVSRRLVKKQQMRWAPPGAQHLLNIRTQVLTGTARLSATKGLNRHRATRAAPPGALRVSIDW